MASKKTEAASEDGAVALALVLQLKRLGANIQRREVYPPQSASWPPAIRTLIYDLRWPKGVTYGNDMKYPVPLWLVDFSANKRWEEHDFSEFPCCKGKQFALLGYSDGGNYLIVVSLDDKNPSNPQAFVIDHDCSQKSLPKAVQLSKLLADLEPEMNDGN